MSLNLEKRVAKYVQERQAQTDKVNVLVEENLYSTHARLEQMRIYSDYLSQDPYSVELKIEKTPPDTTPAPPHAEQQTVISAKTFLDTE